jgi:hypothetical protein
MLRVPFFRVPGLSTPAPPLAGAKGGILMSYLMNESTIDKALAELSERVPTTT